jgi:hypothetical protein
MRAPAHWDEYPVRGCTVCQYGRDATGAATRPGGRDAETCICPNVTGREISRDRPPAGVPTRLARANTGPCGPEAHHLAFPS